jgi:REP element-mobilizing transposase RayT
MKNNTKSVHRHSIRLEGYDYSQPGAYFITLCAKNRECLFGKIDNGEMTLNDYGMAVKETWFDLVNHISGIVLDEFIIMPNHLHGIVVIGGEESPVRAGLEPAPTNALPEIVRQLKTFSARRINKIRQTPGVPVWQRNYFEHVIRGENEINQLRQYIIHNPKNWDVDDYFMK